VTPGPKPLRKRGLGATNAPVRHDGGGAISRLSVRRDPVGSCGNVPPIDMSAEAWTVDGHRSY